MKNFATATIEGNVTRDPEFRKTKTGKSVCTFSLAFNHFSKMDDEPRVSYIEVETWEKLADVCSTNITKGKRLLVMGKIRQDRWDGQDGKPQSKIKIIGDTVRFLEIPRATVSAAESA